MRSIAVSPLARRQPETASGLPTRYVGNPLRVAQAVVVALAAVLALAGCGGGGGGDKDDNAGDAGPSSVRIVDFEFKPKTVTVKPGTSVTWTNQDTNIHDVKDTSPLATPVSQEMSKGDTFSITYAQPGSYTYVCGIHPYMTGTVEVKP